MISTEIRATDDQLENLLVYLEHLHITHLEKQMLCEKAAKWLELGNHFTYAAGFQNLAICQSLSSTVDKSAQCGPDRQVSQEAAK
jgi:hypothetical protein